MGQYDSDHTPDQEMIMFLFLLGSAVGYVLGARAGRDRYDQLARTCERVAGHPAVRGAAGAVRSCVEEAVLGKRSTRS